MILSQLFKLTEKELNAVSKADLIKFIASNTWHFNNLESTITTLNKDLTVAKAPYDQAKLMLMGAVNVDVEREEYAPYKPKLDNVDLCFLIGLLLSRAAKL